MTFFERFSLAQRPGAALSLQLVFPESLAIDPAELGRFVRGYCPEMAEAVVEWVDARGVPEARALVSEVGPPVAAVGLISWGSHIIKVAGFDAPMPYGPIESCVEPALMPPEVKRDAAAHRSHVLLYHGGPESSAFDCYLGLMSVAGAMASLGATAVLNEEARTAIPAFDLIPEPEEDILTTLRQLPILYLMAGFVRTNIGAPDRPWVRTFGCHHLGLPDLAIQAHGYGEMSELFRWFNAMLNYLRETESSFSAGQVIALSDTLKLQTREPHPTETDFLSSEGELIVLERD
jgi:hypothetical protein